MSSSISTEFDACKLILEEIFALKDKYPKLENDLLKRIFGKELEDAPPSEVLEFIEGLLDDLGIEDGLIGRITTAAHEIT